MGTGTLSVGSLMKTFHVFPKSVFGFWFGSFPTPDISP